MAEKISIEACTLLSLIYRDLDDGDDQNALFLSERLYATDKKNEFFIFVYAKCLYHNLDYDASYTVLKYTNSIPCLNLFAKTCLVLGNNIKSDQTESYKLWNEGIDALILALCSKDLSQRVYWGDELASTTMRQHVPSKASLCNLLADLYIKLKNVKAAAKYLWICLESNPYKVTAYNKLCDVAPDCINFDTAKLPKHVFTSFENVDLSRDPNPYLSKFVPASQISDIQFSSKLVEGTVELNKYHLPAVRNSERITIEQLRTITQLPPRTIDDDQFQTEISNNKRSELECIKNNAILSINKEIKREKELRAHRTKHGLYPTRKDDSLLLQDPLIELSQSLAQETYNASSSSIEIGEPPKLVSRDSTDAKIEEQQQDVEDLSDYFFPQKVPHQPDTNQHKAIIQGINKVLNLLCIMATGYMYQSFYCGQETILEFNQLNNLQFNTPTVLTLIGKTYYDTTDYKTAHTYFEYAFAKFPWFCSQIPIYSTCLWYLDLQAELNLLVYKMKRNQSHLYVTYMAAGNWEKLTASNNAIKWFKKAVELNPSKAYGYCLLGYEESDRQRYLDAKSFFARCMVADARCYQAWYGIGLCYKSMKQYVQARTLLNEAYRLHPRHPIVLYTLGFVLYKLQEFTDAEVVVRKSIKIHRTEENQKLLENILINSLDLLDSSSVIY